MEPDDDDDDDDELEEDEDDVEPEEELPPIGFWEHMPGPEDNLDPAELLPPEPIGDFALEEGGVPGTWDCCIFRGEDILSPAVLERECEGEIFGLMLGFIREPGGLPPGGFVLLPPTIALLLLLLPGPDNPCLVIGEDPGLPTPIPCEALLDWGGTPPAIPALPGLDALPGVAELSLDLIFPEEEE